MDTEEASTIVVNDTIYTVAQENSDGLTIKAGMYVVSAIGKDGEVTLTVGSSSVKADTAHFHIVDEVTRKESHPKAAPKVSPKPAKKEAK